MIQNIMKAISCGVIIVNAKNPNQILGCKPYGKHDGRHDLPKGRMEENETPLETAIRETREESGVDLSGVTLIDLGEFKYISKKNLHLFKCILDLDLAKLSCSTDFEIKGCFFPEVIGYEWINIEDIEDKFYHSLGLILKKLL